MNKLPEGNAIVYCEGAFNTPNGKTAHGLVRRTLRYIVQAIVDSRYNGQDAGEVLDNSKNIIPIFGSVEDAFKANNNFTHFVIGLAPDGGRLNNEARNDIKKALQFGLNIDCGLHDFLTEDREITALAKQYNVTIRDIRKTPSRKELHFYSGKIEEVNCLKVAVLGTDSVIGKRTTAWNLVEGFRDYSLKAEMIGTGQTAWMQGAKYSIILDSLINDFVSGEIEHAVWSAWKNEQPDVIVIEGQGSMMNPAYPGGFEILAAGKPDIVVLQHAPARLEYDGFPGYELHPLSKQIEAIELISQKPVVLITINHENLTDQQLEEECRKIKKEAGLTAIDPLKTPPKEMAKLLKKYIK
jgi:uncharacterized NAD-dependent epimerase/dehydratase family protein